VLYLIYNPVAGRGRAPAALAEATRLLDAARADYVVHHTQGPGHATELASAAPAGATVVAVGGDGTVHQVVKGLLTSGATDRVLGVLPVGSGDDFAFALGLDRHDVSGAVARLLANEPHLIDLPTVNGEPFVNALGVGFDAEVAYRLERVPAIFKGLAAYLYAVMVSLGRLRSVGVTVTVDGVEVYAGKSLVVATQNGPRTGGSFLFSPAARLDDGTLDVVLAGDVGVFATLVLLPKVMRGKHLGDPSVRAFRGASARLEWDEPRYAHADGESLGQGTTFTVAMTPRALRVLR
jgi:YegS/Rv2252/BmrU family lipid kinase